VAAPLEPFIHGTPLDRNVEEIAQGTEELNLPEDAYALEGELQAVHWMMASPSRKDHDQTHYAIYALDLWVDRDERRKLRDRKAGFWLTCSEAAAHPEISPTALRVFRVLERREQELDA
jgi:hypothetical protein